MAATLGRTTTAPARLRLPALDRAVLRRSGWLLGAWTAFAVLAFLGHQVSTLTPKPAWERELLLDLALAWTWAALTPLVVHLARQRITGRWAGARTVAMHLILAMTIAVAFAALRTVLDTMILRMWSQQMYPMVLGYLLLNADLDVVLYFVIIGVTHAADQLREYRDRALRAAALESELSGAQLRFLERQLQPHFLFNCLHAITELAYEAPAAARHIISDLQSLLRSAVSKAGRDEVALAEELDTLQPYVDIQRARFSDWLTVTTNVDADARHALMPPFVLQPLVENAIRHGLIPRGGPGRVEITARVDGRWLSVQVRDDGQGLPHGTMPSASGYGIGLRNVRERLRHLYGPDHWFALSDNPDGGTCVDIRIPYQRVSPSPAPRAAAADAVAVGDGAAGLPLATTPVAPAETVPFAHDAHPSPPLTARDWVFLATGWALFGTFWYLQPYLGRFPFHPQRAVREMLLYAPLNISLVLVWAALTPAVLFVARRVRVGVGRVGRPLLIHIAGAIVFSLLQVSMIVALDVEPRSFRFAEQPQSVVWNLFVYAALVAWSHGRDYFAWRRERELESLKLESAIARARWRSLCVSLRPDFVCETLDIIAALIDDDASQAERMTARLADLLRLTLDSAAEPWIALTRELGLLTAYTDLRRTIEAGRACLRVQIVGGRTHGDRPVPNRLLRALLEDAGPASVRIEISEVSRGTRIAVVSDRPIDDAAEVARQALAIERLTVRVVDSHEVVFVVDDARRRELIA